MSVRSFFRRGSLLVLELRKLLRCGGGNTTWVLNFEDTLIGNALTHSMWVAVFKDEVVEYCIYLNEILLVAMI